MAETPARQPVMCEASTGGINPRDVLHADYKVVGEQTLKIVNVYIVDKGKPLAVAVDQSGEPPPRAYAAQAHFRKTRTDSAPAATRFSVLMSPFLAT